MKVSPDRLRGARVAVVGLGVSNLSLIRFLLRRGARVTACDCKTLPELGERGAEVARLPVELRLGPDYLAALETCDVVCLTPGMRKDLPEVRRAQDRGALLTGEVPLFLELCRAPVCGVTGSAGKSTTATLVARILETAGVPVTLGGNIGRPLIEEVDTLEPDRRVVMELSSFQLELCRRSPGYAACLNLRPDHLDVHADEAAYRRAKENIFLHQDPGDVCVLNLDDPATRDMSRRCPGRVLFVTLSGGPLEEGAWVEAGRLVTRVAGSTRVICDLGDVRLRGSHNRANILFASLLARLLGAPASAAAETARTFGGLRHRLEIVRELHGVTYVNDSIATAPLRAQAALATFPPGRTIVIAGGSDKRVSFDDYGRAAAGLARHIILLGETGPRIAAAVEAVPQSRRAASVHRAPDLAAAVELARSLAGPGDTVLLSPACASFDMFRNYRERGEQFRALVEAL